jgi:hypothetical protein
MASPTQLIETMAQTLGITWAACDSTWKELRSRNMVVNSGRGKRGTKVTARDCAVFLLALCGADHVKDSAEAAETYGNCVLDGRSEPLKFAPLSALGSKHTLLDAIEAIIHAYETGNIPLGEMSMVLPDGRTTVAQQVPSVFLILTSPPPEFPARIGINHDVIAEYQRKRSVEEMFAGVAEGSKRRIVTKGDLQIEKRITTATFNKLGDLLTEDTAT